MATISVLKEMEVAGTPLFLFACTLPTGDVQYWSTHNVTFGGQQYLARVLKHNLFELKSSPDSASDGVSKVSITLANADAFLSSIERDVGWKGSQLTVTFLFFDLGSGVAASDTQVMFQGVANPPDESTESTLRLSFTNVLNLQRVYLPDIHIQRLCPWTFPATALERQQAVSGGSQGAFSPFYRCGYSPDQTGGVGNLNGAVPFDTCDYTRAECQQRGMFDTDNANNITRRFGGIEFLPPSIAVRSYGERGSHISLTLPNQALYNDFVPLVYGTGWYEPPVVFARNDGNLTHLEVLLGAGPINGVLAVVVNDTVIPVGISGTNMTATGWYNIVSLGGRNGSFNLDFTDANGNPLGDPYGSMAFMSVVVPNNISNGLALPELQVLVQGLTLARFDTSGNPLDTVFTNNPAWILLDAVLRGGWALSNLDLASFGVVAPSCDALVPTFDIYGNSTLVPRYQCNLLLTYRRSAGDVVRGVRNGSALYLTFGPTGLLQLNLEDTLALQQPAQLPGSNSTEPLNGGWPAYEFGDNAFSGIARSASGASTVKVTSRATADSPNQYTVEFQDEFNEFQQDSLSLVSTDDLLLTGQTVTTSLTALGLPNFDQATGAAALQLYKSVYGNTSVEFETSVKGAGLKPGDLITLTYSREGFNRQPFRITKISPGVNFHTAVITAQIHDDTWYTATAGGNVASGQQPGSEIGLPRPLVGGVFDSNGVEQFAISESSVESTDGSMTTTLSVGFMVPEQPAASQAGIPLVGLNPQINTSGGTIAGAQNLYYAVSAVDANGAEGGLSFTIMAAVPAATNTNQVTLVSLSFSSAANSFHVYRGTNPAELLRIAQNVTIANQFADTGLAPTLVGPPDYNYDHANFYWRMELQPEESVNLHSATTIGNSGLDMLPNEYNGATVRITQGTGAGQEQIVASNTPTTLTIAGQWGVVPDATSQFVVADSTFQFGASGSTSPVSFVVPNREGLTVEVSGRAANIFDEENAYALSPLTRWRITGATGSSVDTDVPGVPTFALFTAGQGTVEALSIGFTSLSNTTTISAGTLTLAYWDELQSPASITLTASVGTSDSSLSLSSAISAQAGDLVQVDSEVMLVQQAVSNSTSVPVVRGSDGSSVAAHTSPVAIYFLQKKTFIMPFPADFFGSPASGSYAFPVTIPDVRIAAAELFVTNSQGNSGVASQSFTNTTDLGLRTLSGGQLSFQIEGPLAIQTNAAPPLLMENAYSVRDVSALVQTAPTGSAISLEVTQNGLSYCALTIAIDATTSGPVDGFALGPLAANAQVGLNITSVTETSGTLPGSDLTVTIRI